MLIPIPGTYGLYSVDTELKAVISYHGDKPLVRKWGTYHDEDIVRLYLKDNTRNRNFTRNDMEKLIKESEKEMYIVGFKQADGRCGFMLDEKGEPSEYSLAEALSACANGAIKNPSSVYTYYLKQKTCRANQVTWSN